MSPVDRGAYAAELRRVAKGMGLPLSGDLEQAIIDHCKARLAQVVAGHERPTTLDGLLALAAACLDLEIVEVRGDADFQKLLKRIPPQREPVMAQLHTLLGDDTDGVLVRRQRPEPWDKPFLAVISCCGWHDFRRYFTKWHEIAHRLVEGHQLLLAFRQTRAQDLRRDPEEVLVDRVAAALAFAPEIFEPVFHEELERATRLTFDVVDETRQRVVSEASRHATLLACLRCCPEPVYFLRCEMGFKRDEQRALASPQLALLPDYVAMPQAKLRVSEVTGTAAAVDSGIRFHQNMQVPGSSLVARVFHDSWMLSGNGCEQLDEWQTSADGPIGYGEVGVEAVRYEDEVWALVRFGPKVHGPRRRSGARGAVGGRAGVYRASSAILGSVEPAERARSRGAEAGEPGGVDGRGRVRATGLTRDPGFLGRQTGMPSVSANSPPLPQGGA